MLYPLWFLMWMFVAAVGAVVLFVGWLLLQLALFLTLVLITIAARLPGLRRFVRKDGRVMRFMRACEREMWHQIGRSVLVRRSIAALVRWRLARQEKKDQAMLRKERDERIARMNAQLGQARDAQVKTAQANVHPRYRRES